MTNKVAREKLNEVFKRLEDELDEIPKVQLAATAVSISAEASRLLLAKYYPEPLKFAAVWVDELIKQKPCLEPVRAVLEATAAGTFAALDHSPIASYKRTIQ